ncbi:MAG: hypothetical protein WBD00_06840 [Candidatus Omnitrophota bacterium]
MFVKKKHILVILFSSLIISVVFLSTLAGYMLYIQWKKDSFALNYRDSIYKLTAELFNKDVVLSNVSFKIGDQEPFLGKPLFSGSIKNNSNKSITSILLEVYIQEPNGNVVYRGWYYPLGEQPYGNPSVFFGAHPTRNVLLPGEGISFRHPLLNCSKQLVAEVSGKSKFAKRDSHSGLTLSYSIAGMSVL